MNGNPDVKLGLIGENIARSRSPLLHRLAGAQTGLDVTYDRLVPRDMNLPFEAAFEHCHNTGFRGINVTYPYKERVVSFVTIDDPFVRAMGAVNTVLFEQDGPKGFNTDSTGFDAAYRRTRGTDAPGTVLMIGTGGVGRAIAFALARLGVRSLRLADKVPEKAEALAQAINSVAADIDVSIWVDAERAASGALGIVNCTPIGMSGYEGTPLDGACMAGAEWAFDAVYTPADTTFLTDAEAHGLAVISGWELFFYQGVHAWKHFVGTPLDEDALRKGLLESREEE